MSKTFRVKNFRCFKDLQINDLGRVNLIVGKNNTGKTALLEAMYLLTKPLTPIGVQPAFGYSISPQLLGLIATRIALPDCATAKAVLISSNE